MSMIKVVTFGPESTGKTTLAEKLASVYKTSWVPEYAREYLEKRPEICSLDDIMPIAYGQIALEEEIQKKANRVLFCDTNILQTKVYSVAYFDTYPPPIVDLFEKRNYDLYLLTDIDVPWEADPLRDRPHMRKEMYELFENELILRKLPFIKIGGNLPKRLSGAQKAIQDLLGITI